MSACVEIILCLLFLVTVPRTSMKHEEEKRATGNKIQHTKKDLTYHGTYGWLFELTNYTSVSWRNQPGNLPDNMRLICRQTKKTKSRRIVYGVPNIKKILILRKREGQVTMLQGPFPGFTTPIHTMLFDYCDYCDY